MEILFPSTWQVITITGWLVVLGFNTTSTVKIIPCRSVTHFSFQSHRLHFSHASAEVRGKNTPERKFTQTGDQTHNHQVMSLTRLTNERQSYFIGLLDGFQCIRSFILMVVLSGGRSVGISIFVLLGFLMTGACKYYSKIHSSKKHKILTLSLTSPCF